MDTSIFYEIARETVAKKPIVSNPFFEKLKDPELTKPSFLKSQVPFFHVINAWSQLHGLLLSKLTKVSHRILIMKNLWNEHGYGMVDNSHIQRYFNYLVDLGFPRNNEPKVSEHIETFLAKLYLSSDDTLNLIACMAIIEYSYITVNEVIVEQLSKRNWIEAPKDKELSETYHVDNLFSVLSYYYSKSSENKQAIRLAFEYGYDAFFQLYENLAQEYLT